MVMMTVTFEVKSNPTSHPSVLSAVRDLAYVRVTTAHHPTSQRIRISPTSMSMRRALSLSVFLVSTSYIQMTLTCCCTVTMTCLKEVKV